jgi:predicted AlkP superfamily pyrophosphatase or phosphodiesterase
MQKKENTKERFGAVKKVILLLVDSLMPSVLENCFQKKTIPALQFLKDRGQYNRDCVTVFPTMTASVDSSLVTGVYPNDHRIPGLVWFDPEEKKIVNYINGWKCVRKLGVGNCARDLLYHLNEKHLSKKVRTIFEELGDRGKTSASINAIIHRGHKKHPVQLPFLMNMMTKFEFSGEISGPEVLTLGAMVPNGMENSIPQKAQRIRQLYGINDDYAVAIAKKLIQSENQPDFMLVYLPDNDHKVHKTNPDHAEEPLISVDKHIQEILNTFESWESALKECVFIVTSDHGQTKIGGAKEEFNIDLDDLLRSFRVLQLGERLDEHDLVLCNNERMAYIYPLKEEKMQTIQNQLLSESRFDIVAWKKDQGILVKEGGSQRNIYFEPGEEITDIYGVSWNIQGEREVLDLSEEQGIICYGDYPDVLSRLYGALYSQDLPMIVITARPRYEFKTRYFPMHLNGGAHGSLHKFDSHIPLIVAGAKERIKEPTRLIDLKKFIVTICSS